MADQSRPDVPENPVSSDRQSSIDRLLWNVSFWYFNQSMYPIGTERTAKKRKIQIELDFPIFVSGSGSGSTSTVSFRLGPLNDGN